jgi:hypothetical protein
MQEDLRPLFHGLFKGVWTAHYQVTCIWIQKALVWSGHSDIWACKYYIAVASYIRLRRGAWLCSKAFEICHGYQENRHLQQLFKAFIVFILRPLLVSALTGHHQVEHNIIYKEFIILTTDPLSVIQIVLCTLFVKFCRRLF